ncbi:MAG: ArsR family transcriptional regulator, partial [archaeon GB-1867-035]|nr:ArsR family transcriptional regulator [Candidatus Culexmicrobium profundum]
MLSPVELYLDKYTQYLNLLNEPTAKLISVLSKVNPRNVSEVARALGLSPSLTHYHLKRLISKHLLRISAKIN